MPAPYPINRRGMHANSRRHHKARFPGSYAGKDRSVARGAVWSWNIDTLARIGTPHRIADAPRQPLRRCVRQALCDRSDHRRLSQRGNKVRVPSHLGLGRFRLCACGAFVVCR